MADDASASIRVAADAGKERYEHSNPVDTADAGDAPEGCTADADASGEDRSADAGASGECSTADAGASGEVRAALCPARN